MLKTSTLLLQFIIGLAATSCDWDTSMSGAEQPIAAATSTTNTSTTTTITNNNASSATITTITITVTTDMTIITTTTTTTTYIIKDTTTNSCPEIDTCMCDTLQLPPPPPPPPPNPCPQSGYQHFPGFGCYKSYSSRYDRKTWNQARWMCQEDGADLWVIETKQERYQVFIPLYNSVEAVIDPFVGVFKSHNKWKTVKNQPVPSSWWRQHEPEKNVDYKCAIIYRTGLMGDVHCTNIRPFVCEIPI